MNDDLIFDQLCDTMAPICRPYVKGVLEKRTSESPITKDEVRAFLKNLLECEELYEMCDDLKKEAEIFKEVENMDFNSLSDEYIDEESLILARQLVSHWTVTIRLAMEGKPEIELGEDFYPKHEDQEDLDLIARRSSLTRQDIRDIMQRFLDVHENVHIQEGIKIDREGLVAKR